MTDQELLAMFLDQVPAEYPKHMFHFFADRAVRGILLPFTKGLLRVIGFVEASSPGYAAGMLGRIAAIQGIGESQYEALLLCEFARKKANLSRRMTSHCLLLQYVLYRTTNLLFTIVSFSAELPVIRGRDHSRASSGLFVRDQESGCASHFRPCWP